MQKKIIGLIFIALLATQVVFTTILVGNNNTIYDKEKTSDNYKDNLEIITNTNPLISTVLATPTLTRPGYPIILSDDTASGLWNNLNYHHVDNIRIAYYDEINGWQLVPFQLDEKAYLRSYIYQQGGQADVDGTTVTAVDISNWGQIVARHGYVGKDLDAQPGDPYKEPTKFECEDDFWDTRLAEGWASNDNSLDPGKPDPAPTADPGDLQQLEHRIDYDDELVFYAEMGCRVDRQTWPNQPECNLGDYPYRYEIIINDPVDDGQSWMYLFFNHNTGTTAPTPTWYIPPGGQDMVDWNPSTLTLTTPYYSIISEEDNPDLASLTLSIPGFNDIPFYHDGSKAFASIGLHIEQTDPYGGTVFDITSHADIWMEGQWFIGDFDESERYLGSGITMDLDLPGISTFPGQDTYMNNGHQRTPYSGSIYHNVEGDYNIDLDDERTAPYVGTVTFEDDADHDQDTVEQGTYIPFYRGRVDGSAQTKEAAIDGPCRVILRSFAIRRFSMNFHDVVEYEEFWMVDTIVYKFYANMYEVPYVLDTDYSTPYEDQTLEANLHYLFFDGKILEAAMKADPSSIVMIGRAPNGEPGILKSFSQCNPKSYSFPLMLDPNGVNDDVIPSDQGPELGHWDNTPLIPSSVPFGDWYIMHTSQGGVWSYIPYNEFDSIFDDEMFFWRDAGTTELALYGNDATTNGMSSDIVWRNVMGYFNNEWEGKREYARYKYQLKDSLYCISQTYYNLAPIANFYANNTNLIEGETVAFTFTGSEGNAPATFEWNFGDGGTSTAQNPTHIYTEEGIYTVILTVTDFDGDTSYKTRSDYITVIHIPIKTVIEIIKPGRIIIDEFWWDMLPSYKILIDGEDLDSLWYNLNNGINMSISFTGPGTYSGFIDKQLWDQIAPGIIIIKFLLKKTNGEEFSESTKIKKIGPTQGVYEDDDEEVAEEIGIEETLESPPVLVGIGMIFGVIMTSVILITRRPYKLKKKKLLNKLKTY